MFPEWGPRHANHLFFTSWKENSIFDSIIGPPPSLLDDFGPQWIKSVENLIGDIPIKHNLFAHYDYVINNIKRIEKHERLLEKIRSVDERFFPTMSELDFFSYLSENINPSDIHLEGTFSTESGRHPELMLTHNKEPIFCEVTRISDYQGMDAIVDFYLTISGFQLGFEVNDRKKSIIINFIEYPNESLLKTILADINWRFNKEKRFNISHSCDEYNYTISDGDALEINMPEDTLELKIKDKLDEKTSQFNDDDQNFVAIDVSLLMNNMDSMCKNVRDYYDYTENKTIWGTILFRRRWSFEDFRVHSKIEIVHQANQNIDTKKALDIMKEALFYQ